MKKWVMYIVATFFCGLAVVIIGTIVEARGLLRPDGTDGTPIYYLIYYTDFLLVCCTGIVVAKVNQLRDDLRKK